METDKQPTCAERIGQSLANLEEGVSDILKGYYEGEEEGWEEWNNFPLAVSTRLETKIEISWGGPSSFLTVSHDLDGTIYSVIYHFQDWFDGATQEVAEGSKVWEYAQTVIEARSEMELTR